MIPRALRKPVPPKSQDWKHKEDWRDVGLDQEELDTRVALREAMVLRKIATDGLEYVLPMAAKPLVMVTYSTILLSLVADSRHKRSTTVGPLLFHHKEFMQTITRSCWDAAFEWELPRCRLLRILLGHSKWYARNMEAVCGRMDPSRSLYVQFKAFITNQEPGCSLCQTRATKYRYECTRCSDPLGLRPPYMICDECWIKANKSDAHTEFAADLKQHKKLHTFRKIQVYSSITQLKVEEVKENEKKSENELVSEQYAYDIADTDDVEDTGPPAPSRNINQDDLLALKRWPIMILPDKEEKADDAKGDSKEAKGEAKTGDSKSESKKEGPKEEKKEAPLFELFGVEVTQDLINKAFMIIALTIILMVGMKIKSMVTGFLGIPDDDGGDDDD